VTPNADPASRWATVRELQRQPEIWRTHAEDFARIAEETRDWLAGHRYDEIWLSGAGSSAFIGDTLSVCLNAAGSPARFRSIPSTDLVAMPRQYLRQAEKLLIVLFGRSGDSSETLGALDILDQFKPDADRLQITCNKRGQLALRTSPSPGRQRVIILPEETNDSGFAMTSSYSTMLLVALAAFDQKKDLPVAARFEALARAAAKIIRTGVASLLDGPIPDRAVFLGSGPLTGAAREVGAEGARTQRGPHRDLVGLIPRLPSRTEGDRPCGHAHLPAHFEQPPRAPLRRGSRRGDRAAIRSCNARSPRSG
jgi:fructoselysine-6-P-deglycase FrlB-like protein